MKRTTTSAVPYPDTLATQVMADGFMLSSCDYQDFTLGFDTDSNQTPAKTSTGLWAVNYNAQNRPVRFTQSENIIECQYDSHGRHVFKKVSVAGAITLHHRYLYRGYVQITTIDMTRSGLNSL